MSDMAAEMMALEWPRTFFIDDRGEVIPWEMPGSASSRRAHNDDDPCEAMLERGFIKINRCEREALVSLRPDRVNPVTMAGAVDALARLGQDWIIVWPLTPGCQVEWFRSYTPAIHRIRSLLEEAGQLPPCPGYDDILAEALRFESGSSVPLAEVRGIGNTQRDAPTRSCASQADNDPADGKSGGRWQPGAMRASPD